MEFLKEVFGSEALTYDQLAEKLKGSTTIKLGNLAGGAYPSYSHPIPFLFPLDLVG